MSVDGADNSSKSPSVVSRGSYRGRSSGYNAQILEATYSFMQDLNNDIDIISSENMKLRASVDELESQLDAITKALKENLDTSNEINQQIMEENSELTDELEKRNELIDVVRPMVDQCLQYDPHLFEEYSDLNELMRTIKQRKVDPMAELNLDPLLNKILPGIEYFRDVKTNEEFLERCKLIRNEINRLEQAQTDPHEMFETQYEKANVEMLRKQLKSVQNENDIATIDYSERIKELNKEKEELLEEKRKLMNADINPRTNLSSAQTPKASRRPPKSPRSGLSPITYGYSPSPNGRKIPRPSPLKF